MQTKRSKFYSSYCLGWKKLYAKLDVTDLNKKIIELEYKADAYGGRKYELQLSVCLFGLYLLFGWFGNRIWPAIHFDFTRMKGATIGLLQITLRTSLYLETRIYVRLGQLVYRDIFKPDLGKRRVWCVDIDSQHFVSLARKLALDKYYWDDSNTGTFLKKAGLVNYRVISECDSGDYIAEGRILFIKHSTMM